MALIDKYGGRTPNMALIGKYVGKKRNKEHKGKRKEEQR